MSATRLHTKSPQVLFTELDDGTGVLLHLDTKFYYTLNPTAVMAWKALDAGSAESIATIADRMTREFQVDRDAAEKDVQSLFDDLIAGGLILESTR
jgi:hypothetical protein